MEAVPVAIALGSNLGDRQAHLTWAVGRLAALLDDLAVSSFLESPPHGVAPQPDFLNAAAVGLTRLAPRAVLQELQALERARGRERPRRGAPRMLDLDLVLYGDRIVREPDLDVPHPRFRERYFVLQPLASIVPDMRDPVTGRTVAELLAALGS